MGTTDENGIYFYDDTDGAPTPPVLNVGQQSVSDALSNLGTYRSVADDAEQAILVAAFAPSPTKPLLIYRQDYQAARAWRWTIDGVTWRTFATTQALGSVGNSLGFTGANTTVYAEGDFISISGYIQSTGTGGISTTWKQLGVVNVALAPSAASEIFPIYSNLPVPIMGRILANGAVQAAVASGFATQALTSAHVFYYSPARWKRP